MEVRIKKIVGAPVSQTRALLREKYKHLDYQIGVLQVTFIHQLRGRGHHPPFELRCPPLPNGVSAIVKPGNSSTRWSVVLASSKLRPDILYKLLSGEVEGVGLSNHGHEDPTHASAQEESDMLNGQTASKPVEQPLGEPNTEEGDVASLRGWTSDPDKVMCTLLEIAKCGSSFNLADLSLVLERLSGQQTTSHLPAMRIATCLVRAGLFEKISAAPATYQITLKGQEELSPVANVVSEGNDQSPVPESPKEGGSPKDVLALPGSTESIAGLVELAQHVKGLQDEIPLIHSQYNAANERVKNLDGQIQNRQARLQSLKREYDTISRECENLEKDLQDWQRKLEDADLLLQQKRDQLSLMRRQLEPMKALFTLFNSL